MTDQDMLIRRRIRTRMTDLKLTQVELSRQLGIKPSSLGQVLSGARGKVPKSLLNVLEALGLQVEVVLTESEKEAHG